MLRLLRKIHNDQQGAVSLETILVIGAIALPILIFLIRYGWPYVRSYFEEGMEDLKAGADEGKVGTLTP